MTQHIQGLLDGLEIPEQAKPLEAYIQPPPIDISSGPKAYIVGSTGSWKRQTMPRGPGFQQFTWPINIYLTLLTSTQIDSLDIVMPAFLDVVLWTLLTAEMPIFITDPVTGRETQLWQIGEDGKIDNPPGRNSADMRMLQYGAGIAVTVKEIVQA